MSKKPKSRIKVSSRSGSGDTMSDNSDHDDEDDKKKKRKVSSASKNSEESDGSSQGIKSKRKRLALLSTASSSNGSNGTESPSRGRSIAAAKKQQHDVSVDMFDEENEDVEVIATPTRRRAPRARGSDATASLKRSSHDVITGGDDVTPSSGKKRKVVRGGAGATKRKAAGIIPGAPHLTRSDESDDVGTGSPLSGDGSDVRLDSSFSDDGEKENKRRRANNNSPAVRAKRTPVSKVTKSPLSRKLVTKASIRKTKNVSPTKTSFSATPSPKARRLAANIAAAAAAGIVNPTPAMLEIFERKNAKLAEAALKKKRK